ncbi:aspartate/glutamate racemase family protein [Rhizobium sp. LC145]|uniref:aspartate/glutamate racemase family protein n=1 Tax=Rhizobium sp. LC145 TaxID=1120688 RepID=UPI00062A28BF|nr:aspartate/glutamate racemase family protein [Rhizobium sp. LC145]KKX33456.1 Asp/Glu/hydantoin racemase [Rhizobium sp. LC145]TKT58708.1 aspartate/glutamate racemase family protein [Rhizobiaceae bacterium LC148]
MKIAVINPNTTAEMTQAIGVAAARSAAPTTELLIRQSNHGPSAIEGPFDGAICLPGLLGAIQQAEAEGASAHVIACFDDTGLDAARALSHRPVIGVGEAALHVASLIAQEFCVVTTLSRSVPTLKMNILRYGFERRCPQVLASDIPVLDLHRPESGAHQKISSLIARAMENGAEAAILGCAGMADLAAALQQELGVPVIDGIEAAIRLAEMLAASGFTPSKHRGWAFPSRAGDFLQIA